MTVQAKVTRHRTWLATHLDPSFSMLLALPLNIPWILYANNLVLSQNCLSPTSFVRPVFLYATCPLGVILLERFLLLNCLQWVFLIGTMTYLLTFAALGVLSSVFHPSWIRLSGFPALLWFFWSLTWFLLLPWIALTQMYFHSSSMKLFLPVCSGRLQQLCLELSEQLLQCIRWNNTTSKTVITAVARTKRKCVIKILPFWIEN